VAAGGRLQPPLLWIGLAAAFALLTGLLGGWPTLAQLAVSLLVAQYGVFLLDRDEVDAAAPLVAAGLVVVAELTYGALEPPTTRRGLARFAVTTVAVAIGAAALGAFLVGVASFSSGTLVEAGVGLAAAAATIALVTWLAWTPRARR
jgi:hypothetical protein